MAKYSVEDRQNALIDKLDKQANNIRRRIFNREKVVAYDGEVFDGEKSSALAFGQLRKIKDFDIGFLLSDSQRKRKLRVKKKIADIVFNKEAVFLTLTFNDDVLENTTSSTRRQYVRRYLNRVSGVYVANIDYGGRFGREHYHAVVNKSVDLAFWHKYGGIKAERVRDKGDDLERVSRYVSKLTNHALKNKGDQVRLIYSRDML